jgi:NADH:ubiquinone oxidoreductase subunit 4 (subunit M)
VIALLLDAGGVAGVLMVLAAYAGIHVDRLDPKGAPALLLNLVGSVLILLSMVKAFNLSAFLMEASWALVALYGLWRLRRR